MLLFHEVHVDDFALEARRDRETYAAAVGLVEAILEVAEAREQRVALRIRHLLAEAALAFEGPDNAIRRWEQRGHEIGAHAHRRRIRRSAEALRAAGVQRLDAVVPGLIRSTRAECARVLAACRHLGFTIMTDQPQHGAFPYSGLTPWRPALDLSGPGDGPMVFADVSVNPFAWGLLFRQEGEVAQAMGLREEHFDRLLGLLDAHLRLPRPHPVTYFGYPVHEHNHSPALYELSVDEASLRAWDDFLSALEGRPVTPALPRDVVEAWIAEEGAAPADPAPPHRQVLRLLDPRDLRHDGPSWLRERLRPEVGPLIEATAPLRELRMRGAEARKQRRARKLEAELGGERTRVQVGERQVEAVRYGPANPRAVVVISHAGRFGGTTLLLEHFGLRPDDLPGIAIRTWDRSGTGASRGQTWLAPGNPQHVDEAAAVFAQAASEGVPTGWISFSAGCLPPLLALKEAQPDFFIEAEGPSDRRSIAPGRPRGLLQDPVGAELDHLSEQDDAAWSWREPYRLLAALPCRYHRFQAEIDHVHGRCALHARVMLEHAPPGALLNGEPWGGELNLLPGRLHDNAERLRLLILQEIEAALNP